ncbi:MAG: hypothetical protein KGJ59_00110 [Bacteroidota bacterium]|nr:hypothetical protein [Bacteroidota bacterium]
MKHRILFWAAVCLLGIVASSVWAGTKSFSVKSGGTLFVDVKTGEISLEPWEKEEVSVEAKGIPEREVENLLIENTDDGVRVKYNPSHRWNNSRGPSFAIRVPSQYNAELRTGGGRIEEHGSLRGTFDATTGGGEVHVERIVGNMKAKTGGGEVRIDVVEGDADLRTGGGQMNIHHVTGALEVSTGGGQVHVDSVQRSLNVKTGGGSIEVTGAPTGTRLSTGGGSLEVNGSKGRIEASTGGGHLELKSLVGSVEASTGGGSVSAELDPTDAEPSKIMTGGGDIEFSVPANAKATIHAIIRLEDASPEDYGIVSDFEAQKNSTSDDDEINRTYILNGGGQEITLKTTNANIEIRKK